MIELGLKSSCVDDEGGVEGEAVRAGEPVGGDLVALRLDDDDGVADDDDAARLVQVRLRREGAEVRVVKGRRRHAGARVGWAAFLGVGEGQREGEEEREED